MSNDFSSPLELRHITGNNEKGKKSDLGCRVVRISCSTGPPQSHAHAYCSTISRFDRESFDYFFFGGCSWIEETRRTKDYDFLYRYDPILKSWLAMEQANRIAKRYRHSMILRRNVLRRWWRRKSRSIEQLVVFGGLIDTIFFCNELFAFDLGKKTWKKLNYANAPAEVAFHTALYQRKNDIMITFGGKTAIANRNNDLHFCYFKKKRWRKIISQLCDAPRERGGHSMDWSDKTQETMIVFG